MTSKPVCIIPARGGSKRIPKKNIRLFNGKPLIAWSIECALKSDLFEQVLVSTDDDEIANISRKYGADVPFIREARLADDFTATADVLKDMLSQIEPFEHACCFYATAPLITPNDLLQAYQKLISNNADAVISVADYDFHPLRAFEQKPDGFLDFKWPENSLIRSQDLPELLHDAGAFYFFNTASFYEQGDLVMAKTLGHKLERMRAVDIDTLEDFEFAELLHSGPTKEKVQL